MQHMNVGDTVRVLTVPPNLKDDKQLKTRHLFELCVGRCFVVQDIESPSELSYRLVRLDVGHVVGEPPFKQTIWIEEQYVTLT